MPGKCIAVTDVHVISPQGILTKRKGEAIPLQAWTGPKQLQEAQTTRISRKSAHGGGKAVSPTHRPPLPPIRHPWYSFLLEAEPTPRP
jgi:hypothetical protein